MTSDAAGQIELVRISLVAPNVWRWVAAALVLALGLTWEKRLQGRPEWIATLGRWPHAVASGAGLVWWALLSPSVVGLVIMGLAAASLAVQSGRNRASEQRKNLGTQLTVR